MLHGLGAPCDMWFDFSRPMALHTLCNLLSMMMTLKMADHRRICIVMNTITWPWSWPWPHQLDSRPWLDVLKMQLHVKTEICTSSYSPNETQTYNTALLLWPWPHDLMTFKYKDDLHVIKMCLHTKMTFLGQDFQKLEHEKDRQTDTHTEMLINA